MTDAPREYDRTYTKPTGSVSGARIRTGYSRERTEITRFVVQLEYCLDNEWAEVVRSDHDAEGGDDMAHDVAEEGVHMDIYREGEKIDTVRVTGPIPPAKGFTTAEEHLEEHAKEYITRFKKWHPTDR